MQQREILFYFLNTTKRTIDSLEEQIYSRLANSSLPHFMEPEDSLLY
jgi:hypothetical protein